MRDTNQPEMNSNNTPAPQTMREQDAQVEHQLERNSVLTYCWAVVNGHRAFYDLNPPKTVSLMRAQNWIEADPTRFGQQYLSVIRAILKERTVSNADKWKRFKEIEAG